MSRIALFAILIASFCSAAKAHEFWVKPVQFSKPSGQPIKAGLFVGQNLRGDEFPYISRRAVVLNVSDATGTFQVRPREGDRPAIRFNAHRDGLHLIAYQSTPSTLTYDSFEKFQTFLTEEGLSHVAKIHMDRGLPRDGFTELFTRYAKSVVQIGATDGELPKNATLRFDWQLLSDPFQNADRKLRLRWQGTPVPNHPVTVMNGAAKQLLRTDDAGEISIPVSDGALLINAVLMQPISDKVAVWHSHWASMVLPPNQ